MLELRQLHNFYRFSNFRFLFILLGFNKIPSHKNIFRINVIRDMHF